MEKLKLPEYPFRICKDSENKPLIFDFIRKKNVSLTPEEWVRQHILRFLVEEKKFPASLISIEAGLKVNRLTRRYDALVYNRNGTPLLLIECKAPNVAVIQKTFDQIAAYNLTLKTEYLLVTNGIKHFCCKLDKNRHSFQFLSDIPSFNEL